MIKYGMSYGICLGKNYDRVTVQNLINSIDMQDHMTLPYEIIVIGDYKNDLTSHGLLRHIMFDETQKNGWITRKKNLLADAACYPTLCFLHDYYILKPGWFEGLVRYSEEHPEWKVLMNEVTRFEGDRHSDWLVNQEYMDILLQKYPELGPKLMSVAPTENNGPRWVCALPYDEKSLTHIQYISGGYILVRRDVLKTHKFDERFGWGEAAEDVIWSKVLIKNGIRFQFNPYNSVSLQKPAKWRVYEMTSECVERLKETFCNV